MKTDSRRCETRAVAADQSQEFKRVEKRLNRSGRKLTTTARTSMRMAVQRSGGTTPEIAVRRLVSSLGHRYRTENRDLPGSPDLANRTRRWAIFVHGCYWHSHEGCPRATVPKRNREFWLAKFERNVYRDHCAREDLGRMGFRVAVIWECEAHDPARVASTLESLFWGTGSGTFL